MSRSKAADLDLRCVYTRLPDRPSAAFPSQTEVWLPLLEVVIVNHQAKKALRAKTLLDTGSQMTLFHSQYADALGIDWRAAPEIAFHGITGGSYKGHAADLNLIIPLAEYSWPARIVFSPDLTLKFPLLGHVGFFEHFEVRFKSSQHLFRIHHK